MSRITFKRPMSRNGLLTGFLACLIGSLPMDDSMAANDDCRVVGGGQFESLITPEGWTRFGGNISSEGCSSAGEIEGAWFATFADGSHFQATDFYSITLRRDGVHIINVSGFGTYESEIVVFELYLQEASSNHPPLTLISLSTLDGIRFFDAGGNVDRGSLEIRFFDPDPRQCTPTVD